MIICGERLILDESDENKTTWKNCILQQGHSSYEKHKFEGLEYTEMKRELILKLASKMNPNTPFWFSRQHNEFKKWSRDQQVTFGIKFLTHADLLKWSILQKLAFLHNISRDHHYVNDVMDLNEKMNKMAITLAAEATRDPLLKEQLEIATKEAQEQYFDRINKN